MHITKQERQILRELAMRVADIASPPVQAEKVRLWRNLNALKPQRPMVLADPQGGWRELLPDSALQCEHLRSWEWTLRSTIFRHEHIHDDYPITDAFNVGWAIHIGGYGLKETQFRTAERGAYNWDPPIKRYEDLKKLHPRTIEIDHEQTARNVALAEELFGDILRVRTRGESVCRCKLTRDLIHLRGLDQMMLDMYEHPQLMHDLMAFLRDDKLREWEIYEEEGVLSLNNGPNNLLGSGGIACTDELPAEDFAGHVRMKDMWCWGESQESVGVGPAQFEEFVLQYQLPLMDRFRLVDYGCCEPLDHKLDVIIRRIPRLRWVSVSPWCDREMAAEKLADRYVYMYKPNPSRICAPRPDYERAERDLRETLEIAEGCCVGIVMKDTHTFQNEPERITHWTDMASRVAAEMA